MTRLDITARALAMTAEAATHLTTLADEPELLCETPPRIDPLDLAAARLRDAWTVAAMLNDPATAAAMRRAEAAQRAINEAGDRLASITGRAAA